MKRFASLAVLAAFGLWARAEVPAPKAVVREPAESDWRPPTHLPPGAEYLLLREDPATHGIQAVVRFPSGYAVPAHTHPCTETLVVMKGTLIVEAEGAATALKAGGYAVLPAGTPHALRAAGWGRTVFTATTDGPYDLTPAAASPR